MSDMVQCVTVCCSVCSVLQRVAVYCSVLQSVLQCDEVGRGVGGCPMSVVLQCAAVCCSVLQCVAVCCSVLQCVLCLLCC